MHDRRATRPRVLQLVTHDRLGGVRTLATMVEAGLVERGFTVDTRALTSERGHVHFFADLWKVVAYALGGRYDAILTYQAAASVLGNLLGWMGRVPIRAAHQTAAPEGIRPHWKLLDRLFGSWGIYTHLVSNSAATTASFASWPAAYLNRFVLIPHGVDPLPPAPGEIDWRSRLAIPADAPLLLATGRLVDQKNHPVAIRALAHLPEAYLVIAGDGPNERELRALAQQLGVDDRLHLVGPIERSKLGDLFAAADVYLFPSIWETFGLAGVEAAMAGLPIIASDLPVLHEVLDLEPEHMVRFHDVHDDAALAAAVRETISSRHDVARRARFAARHVERHSQALMIERYRDFLLRAKVR
jgi:L-malate glycosyltransferase